MSATRTVLRFICHFSCRSSPPFVTDQVPVFRCQPGIYPKDWRMWLKETPPGGLKKAPPPRKAYPGYRPWGAWVQERTHINDKGTGCQEQGSCLMLCMAMIKEDTMARSSRWPHIRKMAWDRDRKARAVCWICGQGIDYSVAPSSTDQSWEPDHVIPVHQRPDLELDLTNIKASHRTCNRARGDGTNGNNDLGQQSRIW